MTLTAVSRDDAVPARGSSFLSLAASGPAEEAGPGASHIVAFAADVLTPREREILAHIGRTGDTLAATGSRLGISERTVKNHCVDVHRKLGVNGNVATFIALGWLKVPDPEDATEPLD